VTGLVVISGAHNIRGVILCIIIELKEQVMYCKGAHRSVQLLYCGKLLVEITALSKMLNSDNLSVIMNR
jgi:hypothetical protein